MPFHSNVCVLTRMPFQCDPKLIKKNEKLLNSLYRTILEVYTKTGILINFEKWINNLKLQLNYQQQKIQLTHFKKLSLLGIKIPSNKQLVYNLSSKKINNEAIKLLEKGPKFVLNCKTSSIHDKVEIENLCKNLKNTNIGDKENIQFTQKLHQLYLKY